MLTPKQYKLLMFIDNSIKENGCCPSFEEMKQAVGIKSKSGIHALIEELIERDFIKKLPHKARALEVLRIPRFKPRKSSRKKRKSGRLCRGRQSKFPFTAKSPPARRSPPLPTKTKASPFPSTWSAGANSTP